MCDAETASEYHQYSIWDDSVLSPEQEHRKSDVVKRAEDSVKEMMYDIIRINMS